MCLWLGANVMLEYSLDDAEELLKKNKESAEKNVQQIAFDLGDTIVIFHSGSENLKKSRQKKNS